MWPWNLNPTQSPNWKDAPDRRDPPHCFGVFVSSHCKLKPAPQAAARQPGSGLTTFAMPHPQEPATALPSSFSQVLLLAETLVSSASKDQKGRVLWWNLPALSQSLASFPRQLYDSQSDRLRLVRWMTNRLWGGWKCDLWCSHVNEVMLSWSGADLNFWAAKLSGFCVTRFWSFKICWAAWNCSSVASASTAGGELLRIFFSASLWLFITYNF